MDKLRGIKGRSIFKKETKKEINKRLDTYEKESNIEKTVNNINFGGDISKKKKKRKDDDYNKNVNYSDLKITKIETNKNKIPQRFLMKENVIPKHPSVCLFVGSIGSGKTTLVTNLLIKPQYYGPSNELQKDKDVYKPYFDVVFLLTGSDDDMYDDLINKGVIKEQHIKFDPTAEDIQKIIDIQAKTIKEKGLINSPKILIILEDIVDNKRLLNSTPLRSLFIKPRQHNFSVWLLSQYMNLVPKFARQQAINLFIFQQNRAGNEIITDQFTPAKMNKNRFLKLIEFATNPSENNSHPFLHINRRSSLDKRFRKNLDQIIKI